MFILHGRMRIKTPDYKSEQKTCIYVKFAPINLSFLRCLWVNFLISWQLNLRIWFIYMCLCIPFCFPNVTMQVAVASAKRWYIHSKTMSFHTIHQLCTVCIHYDIVIGAMKQLPPIGFTLTSFKSILTNCSNLSFSICSTCSRERNKETFQDNGRRNLSKRGTRLHFRKNKKNCTRERNKETCRNNGRQNLTQTSKL